MAWLAFDLSRSGQLQTTEQRWEAPTAGEGGHGSHRLAVAGGQGSARDIKKLEEEWEQAGKVGKELKLLKEMDASEGRLVGITYSSSLYPSRLALVVRFLALLGGFILVLLSWHEVPDSHAGEYHGCMLLLLAGTCLTATANDLVTLFLALELISIPTYVLLYLPRTNKPPRKRP